MKIRIANDRTRGVLDFPVDTDMASAVRGLVKIAYEIAVSLLGDRYLDCESSECVRAFLQDPSADVSALPAKFLDGAQQFALTASRESVLIAGVVPNGREALAYVRVFSRCELGLSLTGCTGDSLGADGVVFVIDVATRRQPVRTTFRELGWFGRS